ncbi:MAG: hypothetical protein F4X17_04275 [Gemmatimonadetes bacterium]|nr:hypothetical protein [Gemmatimonadota bacterium]
MTREEGPPGDDDFEFTVFGPGYGESIVLHVGNGAWVIIDSCVDADGRPHALRYLESIGIDPGGRVLPTHSDINRILTATRNAYVTSDGSLSPHTHYSNRVVDRTLRQSRAQLRRLAPHAGGVRLRRSLGLGRQ